MPILNVRCCCDPGLVLGTLPVPDNRKTDRYVVLLDAPLNFMFPQPDEQGRRIPDTIEIQVSEALEDAPFSTPRTEIAIKSNEIPIETWRKVPGFVEVNRRIPIGGSLV